MGDVAAEPVPEPEHRPQQRGLTAEAFAAFEYRDFRLFWGGSLVSQAGTQMQQAAVAWQVYAISHSPLALGFMGLVRVIPIILFSMIGGVVADALDRRRLLMATQTCLFLLSAAFAITTFTGVITLPLVFLLTGLTAGIASFDNPARQALVPSLVPRDRLTNALSINSTTFQLATVVGPTVAGFVIATRGVGSVYAVNAGSFVFVLTALFLIQPPAAMIKVPRIGWSAAVEGLHFVFHTPILLSTMLLDFIATFFGSAMALLPIFASDILHVGSQGYGVLYAAPATGAVLTGIWMSFFGSRIRAKGLVIVLAVGAYAMFTALFGLSHVFVLSILCLAGTGAADTVSMILRQTIRQLVTPDEMRGRMTSVGMIFFMGGPQLGEVEAGVVARLLGAPFSVISGGVAALIAVTMVGVFSLRLRHYRD